MPTLDYIKELPDVYAKDAGGAFADKEGTEFADSAGELIIYAGCNNWKLLSLEGGLVLAFTGDIDAVTASLDIRKATGKTLDLYGEMVGQYRNGADDDQYRYMISSKVSSNFCDGNYNSTVEQLALVFGCDSSMFSFIENTDECSVTLEAFPLEIVLEAGLTVEQLTEIIKSLLPAGVKLTNFELSGTFEFGGDNDYDKDKGFGNVEQTIGGYLGAVAVS